MSENYASEVNINQPIPNFVNPNVVKSKKVSDIKNNSVNIQTNINSATTTDTGGGGISS